MKNLLLFIFVFSFSAVIFADQCAFISEKQARKGFNLLGQQQVVYGYCELCGDTSPARIEIKKLTFGPAEYKKYFAVKINDAVIDFAYIYDFRGQNLAKQIRCKTQGVTPKITVP